MKFIKKNNKNKKVKSSKHKNTKVKINKEELIETVNRIVQPVCEEEGLDLLHIDYVSGILKIYVDKKDRSQKVNLSDCSKVSSQLLDLFSVNFDEDFNYFLEVSSPGEKRYIKQKQDFIENIGKFVRVKIQNKNKFKAKLLDFSDGFVFLLHKENEIKVKREDIKEIRLT